MTPRHFTFHPWMLAILSGLLMAACSPEKSNAEERLKPVIVAGEIAEKPYAAALTPEGWVGGRRWSWMGGFSEDGVCLVQEKPDGKFGAIDESGKLILPVEYESANYLPGSFAVQKGKAWGFLNRDGSVAIPFTSDWSAAEPFSHHGLAPVKKGDKWGFIDKQGQFAIPPLYEDAFPHGKSVGLAQVLKNGLWGFIDSEGEEVIRAAWAEVADFSGSGVGRAAVRKDKDGLWGYIDAEGELVIPLQFDKAGSFRDGLASVKKGEESMVINVSGEEVCGFASIYKYPRNNERFAIFRPRNGVAKFGIVKDTEDIALPTWFYGLARTDGGIVEPAKWARLIDQHGCHTVVAEDEFESNYSMPVFRIRKEDGTFTPEFSLPLDEVEDIDETGAHTRTLGQNKYPLYPFPVSPEFDDPQIVIPPYRRTQPRTYDGAYFIGWSGVNDKPAFLKGVEYAAVEFLTNGAEAHVFAPREKPNIERQNGDEPRKSPATHDSTLKELKRLITAIKDKHPKGSRVSITFLIGSHGTEDGLLLAGGYSIAGPQRKGKDGKTYEQCITQDVLAYIARETADFDVRFINGTCFGSNTDDAFFVSYLRERALRYSGEGITACSSVIANWHMVGLGNAIDEKAYWPRVFVQSGASSSFLQASFNARLTVDLGPVGDELYEVPASFSLTPKSITEMRDMTKFEFTVNARGKIHAWNIAMTGSERILYYDRLIRTKKFTKDSSPAGRFARPLVECTDELDEAYFSLSQANLARPSNVEFAVLFEDSRKQTEEFLRIMNVSGNVRARLGLGKDGRIDFQRVAEASRNPSIGTLGRRSQEFFVLSRDYQALIEADKIIKSGSHAPNLGRFGQLSSTQVQTKLHELHEKFREMKRSEYDEMQRVLVLIKRLGLMLDFLNDPNVPQKRKDLFAWYRAAELMPLMPPLRGNTGTPQSK